MDKTLARFLDLIEQRDLWQGINSFAKSMILNQARRSNSATYYLIDTLARLWEQAKEDTE